MNSKEHQLMIGMFARQFHMLTMIMEIMKSRGLMETDDVPAFHSVVTPDQASREDLIQLVRKQYEQLANQLGMKVDLGS